MLIFKESYKEYHNVGIGIENNDSINNNENLNFKNHILTIYS